MGVDAFISKPLFRSRLIQVMKELLAGKAKEIVDEKSVLEKLAYSGMRVLLTEDNLMAAEIAQEFIKMAGAEVDHAENGKLVVEMLLGHEPNHYDIVFMDIQMPVMDGYEAASAIRAHAASRPDMGQAPIVALSADAFAEDIRRAHAAGMNDHMPKPLQIEMLVHVMRRWMTEGISSFWGHMWKCVCVWLPQLRLKLCEILNSRRKPRFIEGVMHPTPLFSCLNEATVAE